MKEEFQTSIDRFNEFAKEYEEKVAKIEPYLSHLEKYIELTSMPVSNILELACGCGRITLFLRNNFPEACIDAVDLAPNMIELARNNVPDANYSLMDVRDIDNLNANYDLIMCSFCLPFLSSRDTDVLVENCANLMNSGGLLYISTMEGNCKMAGFESTSFSGDAKVFFNYHEKNVLETYLERNNFHIEYSARQDYKGINTDLILIARKK